MTDGSLNFSEFLAILGWLIVAIVISLGVIGTIVFLFKLLSDAFEP